MLVVSINGWNRIAIPLRTVPGSYQVPADYAAKAHAQAAAQTA